MSGFAGFFQKKNNSDSELLENIKKMSSRLTRQDPDVEDIWIDQKACIAFSHQLTPVASSKHEPFSMASPSSRYVIAFNGEVYNLPELRKQLEKENAYAEQPQNRCGHSDIETILTGIDHWGLENITKQLNGIFSFALWNRKENILHLVRDHLGVKPLYYGWQGNAFLFGSEIKSLKGHPDFRSEIDPNTLDIYMQDRYIRVPYSIYKGINKLEPGVILTINFKNPKPDSFHRTYWSAKEVAEIGASNPLQVSEEEAIANMESTLKDAVKMRMASDGPHGAFLSGGIDSSIIAVMVQTMSHRPIKTFAVGFYENEYNEAIQANAVAKHLKTDHTELYVTPKETMEVIPLIPDLYGEPFADSSQIPTYLISRLARQQVNLCLSGDGGDELFCKDGHSYRSLNPRFKTFVNLPPSTRKFLHRALSLSPFNKLYGFLDNLDPNQNAYRWTNRLDDYIKTIKTLLSFEKLEDFHNWWLSTWRNSPPIVIGASEPPIVFTNRDELKNLAKQIQQLIFKDSLNFLSDDILTKVNGASIAAGLTVRAPLTDHKVMEFALKIPLEMRIRNDQNRWLIRQVLYKYVPENLVDRPKMGFGAPIESWLRGPMRDWAESLLNETRLRHEGYLYPHPIRKKWAEHLSGRYDWSDDLWCVLMFQTWLEHEKILF